MNAVGSSIAMIPAPSANADARVLGRRACGRPSPLARVRHSGKRDSEHEESADCLENMLEWSVDVMQRIDQDPFRTEQQHQSPDHVDGEHA